VLHQVIDAVFGFLDVAVEHGGIGTEADLVSEAMEIDPLRGISLVFADSGCESQGGRFPRRHRAASLSRWHGTPRGCQPLPLGHADKQSHSTAV